MPFSEVNFLHHHYEASYYDAIGHIIAEQDFSFYALLTLQKLCKASKSTHFTEPMY
jgi:hypothetical protein